MTRDERTRSHGQQVDNDSWRVLARGRPCVCSLIGKDASRLKTIKSAVTRRNMSRRRGGDQGTAKNLFSAPIISQVNIVAVGKSRFARNDASRRFKGETRVTTYATTNLSLMWKLRGATGCRRKSEIEQFRRTVIHWPDYATVSLQHAYAQGRRAAWSWKYQRESGGTWSLGRLVRACCRGTCDGKLAFWQHERSLPKDRRSR